MELRCLEAKEPLSSAGDLNLKSLRAQEPWISGPWSSGAFEFRSSGVLELKSLGAQKNWSSGGLELRRLGAQETRSSGDLELRSLGAL
jgi:hypothetical protein